MEVTLYADVLFFVNFSMDFISLWASALISSRPRRLFRMSLGSIVGGIYGILSVLYIPSGIITYLLTAAVSVLMTYVTFGKCGGFFQIIKQSALIFACGALLGGIMTALLSLIGKDYDYTGKTVDGSGISLIVISAFSLIVLIRIIKASKNKRSTDIEIQYGNNTKRVTALCDSGNLLCDPISGDPVICVSKNVCFSVFGREITEWLISCCANELHKRKVGFRFISHKTANGTALCCAALPDKAFIMSDKGKYEVRCYIMPLNVSDGYFGGFSATVPTSILQSGFREVTETERSKV